MDIKLLSDVKSDTTKFFPWRFDVKVIAREWACCVTATRCGEGPCEKRGDPEWGGGDPEWGIR